MTNLHKAAKEGNTVEIKKILAALDRDRDTILDECRWAKINHWANLGDEHPDHNPDMSDVEELLNVDVENEEDDNYTPLHYAAHNNHTDAIRLLVARGADIMKEKEDTEETPLDELAKNQNWSLIAELVQANLSYIFIDLIESEKFLIIIGLLNYWKDEGSADSFNEVRRIINQLNIQDQLNLAEFLCEERDSYWMSKVLASAAQQLSTLRAINNKLLANLPAEIWQLVFKKIGDERNAVSKAYEENDLTDLTNKLKQMIHNCRQLEEEGEVLSDEDELSLLLSDETTHLSLSNEGIRRNNDTETQESSESKES